MSAVYFDLFGDNDAIEKEFACKGALDGATVRFASYSYEDYSGDAIVIFERDGSLWEARGSHCSCNGLEDQWAPTPVTWAAIAMRPVNTYPYSGFAGGAELKAMADRATEGGAP